MKHLNTALILLYLTVVLLTSAVDDDIDAPNSNNRWSRRLIEIFGSRSLHRHLGDGMDIRKPVKTFAPLILVVFILSAVVSMHSQVTGATLSGTISDPSEGVIPGAQISISNTATGISKNFQADSGGYYTAPNLAPGTYEVKVTAQGFSTAVSTVTLAVGAQQQLNLPMKVGETSQTVQVTGSMQQIELTSSTFRRSSTF
jgi:hypothetical protein